MDLSEILGEKRGKEIKEEIGFFLEQTKIVLWNDLRSFSDFISVLNIPQLNKKNLQQRILTNALHYRSNYGLICILIFLTRILFAPFLLLSLILVLSFCFYLLVFISAPIVINDITISNNGKQLICVISTVIFLALCGALERLLWTVMYCILICLLHMTFRPRSVTSKTGKLYDELKLTGFQWFGGQSILSPEDQDPESGIGMGEINEENDLEPQPYSLQQQEQQQQRGIHSNVPNINLIRKRAPTSSAVLINNVNNNSNSSITASLYHKNS